MWEILNIKTPRKGIEKRIAYVHPLSSKNFDKDFRIKEINDFINWLEKWESEESNSNGELTPKEELGLDPNRPYYFLTAKLKTYILEKRFGTYRQLNGAAYLMTFKEIISAEKKIRIRKTIKLGNFKYHIRVDKIDDFQDELSGKEKWI